MYKKATKIWRLIHKIWVVWIFHYRVRVGFTEAIWKITQHIPHLTPLWSWFLWKFLFLSIQFDRLSNFYLFYCNNINKRRGEINNFLYWNLRDKRAPRKNNNGTVLSKMEISSPSLFKFAHREFYWLHLLEQSWGLYILIFVFVFL